MLRASYVPLELGSRTKRSDANLQICRYLFYAFTYMVVKGFRNQFVVEQVRNFERPLDASHTQVGLHKSFFTKIMMVHI